MKPKEKLLALYKATSHQVMPDTKEREEIQILFQQAAQSCTTEEIYWAFDRYMDWRHEKSIVT